MADLPDNVGVTSRGFSVPKKSFLCLLLAAVFCSPVLAADSSAVHFMAAAGVAAHQKTLKRLEDYLSTMTTILSDFTQVAPDGTLTNGRFFLERPGKMRWQYNPPTPILMVSNGSELVYFDYELEQVSHIPLDSTLIGFLARDKIRFNKDVGVIDFSEDSNVIRVTLAQRKSPDDGKLTLEFSDKPLTLRNMVVTDATQQVTTVSLNNARYGVAIDPELFIFRDPRKPRNSH